MIKKRPRKEIDAALHNKKERATACPGTDNQHSSVKHVIGVIVSGGVSRLCHRHVVAANLARAGKRVGILDR